MIVKRYPNRKLYDTEASCYITLDGVRDLLLQGKEVRVIDYASGEDLTAQVLSQVIAGQERKSGSFVPRPILAGLIQAGGATLEVMRRAMLMPIDLMKIVDDEIQHRIDGLIQKGALKQNEGMRWLDLLLAVSPRFASDIFLESEIKRIVTEQGIPTREEIQRLMEQVDVLEKKLNGLVELKLP